MRLSCRRNSAEVKIMAKRAISSSKTSSRRSRKTPKSYRMIAEPFRYFQQFLDFPGGIGGMKDGGTCNQDVRPGSDNIWKSIDVDAAVDFDSTPIMMIFGTKWPSITSTWSM